MSLNTQRIVIMMIMMNLCVATAMLIYENQTYTTVEINDSQRLMYQIEGKTTDDQIAEIVTGNPRTDVTVDESSAIMNMGLTLGLAWDFFANALNPFSLSTTAFTSPIEQGAAKMLSIIRSFFMLLVILEIIAWWRNKKT